MSALDAHLPEPGRAVDVRELVAAPSTPPVFLPYQQRWVGDRAKVKVAEKTRRCGLSWGESGDFALTASAQAAAGGMDCFYIAYEKLMTQQFVLDAGAFARAYDLAGAMLEADVIEEPDKDIQVYRIRFASGFRIEALSSKPRNLRSKQGKVCIDEAAFHEDPEAIIMSAMALLMWGGELHVISTHNGWENPFNGLVQDIRAGRQDYSLHTITLDDAIEDGLYRRICLVRGTEYSAAAEAEWRREIVASYRTQEDAAEELFCIPKRGSGKYFSRVLLEAQADASVETVHLAFEDDFVLRPTSERERVVAGWIRDTLLPALERAVDPEQVSVYGMDFARSGDLSVIWPAQIDRDLTRRVRLNVELRNVPFRQQTQICVALAQVLPKFKACAHDATGNGAQVAEDVADELGADRVHQVKLSAAWYAEHFPRYRGLYDDQKVVIPQDSDVVDDHMRVELVRGKPGIPDGQRTGSEGENRHADAAVAGVMMSFAAEQDGEPAPPVGSITRYDEAARDRAGLIGMPTSAGLFTRFRRATGPLR